MGKAGGLDNSQAIDLTVRNAGDVISVITCAPLVVRDVGKVAI